MTASRKKSYTVTGPSKVHGHEPGATFKALLDPEQEIRLLQGGHLIVAVGKKDDAPPSIPAGATKPRKSGEANETTDGGAS